MLKRIEVFLDDEHMAFVKWMAKRDDVTVSEELRMIFWNELESLEDLYMDEMRQEQMRRQSINGK